MVDPAPEFETDENGRPIWDLVDVDALHEDARLAAKQQRIYKRVSSLLTAEDATLVAEGEDEGKPLLAKVPQQNSVCGGTVRRVGALGRRGGRRAPRPRPATNITAAVGDDSASAEHVDSCIYITVALSPFQAKREAQFLAYERALRKYVDENRLEMRSAIGLAYSQIAINIETVDANGKPDRKAARRVMQALHEKRLVRRVCEGLPGVGGDRTRQDESGDSENAMWCFAERSGQRVSEEREREALAHPEVVDAIARCAKKRAARAEHDAHHSAHINEWVAGLHLCTERATGHATDYDIAHPERAKPQPEPIVAPVAPPKAPDYEQRADAILDAGWTVVFERHYDSRAFGKADADGWRERNREAALAVARAGKTPAAVAKQYGLAFNAVLHSIYTEHHDLPDLGKLWTRKTRPKQLAPRCGHDRSAQRLFSAIWFCGECRDSPGGRTKRSSTSRRERPLTLAVR